MATIYPNGVDAKPVDRSENYINKLNEQPAGVTDNVSELSETPERMLQRVLLPNEVITADFDCYFPFKRLPMWKIITYCIMSLGLFLFVLAFRAIQRWCYRNKCCTPKLLQFSRGKVSGK